MTFGMILPSLFSIKRVRRQEKHPLKTFYITRNRLLFAQRNIQGASKYLTYAYLVSVVAIRDMVKYTSTGKTDLAVAVIKGIWNFIKK